MNKKGRVLSAPASYNVKKRTPAPVIRSSAGMVDIIHEESVGEIKLSPGGVDGPAAASFPMAPIAFPWLGGVAEHYQHYEFVSLEAEYRPLVGTSQAGAVTIAPYYESTDPVLSRGTKGSVLASLLWLKAIPGAEQAAAWAASQVKAKAMDFLRKKYRGFGNSIVGLTQAGDSERQADESRVPGYFLVGTEGGVDATETVIGNLWIKYRVKLSSPVLPSTPSLSLCSTTTTSASLALQSAARAGHAALFHCSGNSIRFLRPGNYSVHYKYFGSSTPLPDIDGFLITDKWGQSKTSAVWGAVHDQSSGALTVYSNSSQGLFAAPVGTTQYASQFHIDVETGDTLEIPALVSGNMTSLVMNITPGSGLHVTP